MTENVVNYFSLVNKLTYKNVSGFISDKPKKDYHEISIFLLDVPPNDIVSFVKTHEKFDDSVFVSYITASVNLEENNMNIGFIETSHKHLGNKYSIYLIYLLSLYAKHSFNINSITLDDDTGRNAVYINSTGKIRKNLYYSLGFKIKNENTNSWKNWTPENRPNNDRFITFDDLMKNEVLTNVVNMYNIIKIY